MTPTQKERKRQTKGVRSQQNKRQTHNTNKFKQTSKHKQTSHAHGMIPTNRTTENEQNKKRETKWLKDAKYFPV
jgi:hypothetical protein